MSNTTDVQMYVEAEENCVRRQRTVRAPAGGNSELVIDAIFITLVLGTLCQNCALNDG
jgi:hypothetical protein